MGYFFGEVFIFEFSLHQGSKKSLSSLIIMMAILDITEKWRKKGFVVLRDRPGIQKE